MPDRLHVGLDFGFQRVDAAYLTPDRRTLAKHCAVANSHAGYTSLKQFLLTALAATGSAGLDVVGEATSYYWLPCFRELAHDPQFAAQDLKLYLLNPRWVAWFRKSAGPDHKTDERDPYYIANYRASFPGTPAWVEQDATMALRFYTRHRFHLVEAKVRESNVAHMLHFLLVSAYGQRKPFSDPLGATSRQVLLHWDDIAKLSDEELGAHLQEWSHQRISDVAATTALLRAIAADSYVLLDAYNEPLQRLLTLVYHHLDSLEQLIRQVDAWIAAEAAKQPGVATLLTVPGLGPVFAAGLVAEIGGVQRFLNGTVWDKRHQRSRQRNLRDAEDAVAKIAGLWWPRNESGEFVAEDRHMAKTGNRYLRYYLVEAAEHLRLTIPSYKRYYESKYKEVTKHQHRRAVVLTARKAVGLVVGLLHRNEAYRTEESTPEGRAAAPVVPDKTMIIPGSPPPISKKTRADGDADARSPHRSELHMIPKLPLDIYRTLPTAWEGEPGNWGFCGGEAAAAP